MSKKVLRIIGFIAGFLILIILFISILDAVNLKTSNYIKAEKNQIQISGSIKNKIYSITDIEASDSSTVTITVNSESGQPLILLLDNLVFPHEIFINNELASQNIKRSDPFYDEDYAYKAFSISGDNTIISIRGTDAPNVNMFIAGSKVMKDGMEIRTITYSVMLMFLVLIALFSIVFFINNPEHKYFLFFAANAVVSIIKSINFGELFAISRALGMNAYHFEVINKITSNINIIMPVIISMYLMDIKIRRHWNLSILPVLGVMVSTAFIGGTSILQLILFWLIYILSIVINIYGCVENKPFSHSIYFNNILFSSFAAYGYLVSSHRCKSGVLDFYVHMAFLGFIVCLSVFLTVFVKSYLSRVKALEEKRKEFERIALLRGIGHDLKLPLSVIKMNSQMLEKYNMEEWEQKEYIKMTMEAATELEKMTDNINSYLNMGISVCSDYVTDVKGSFDKVKRHYSAYSLGMGCTFNAEWHGVNVLIPVRSIQFERILYNLLDNAFKYNKEGGKVELECRVEDKNVCITVSDTGTGMDEEQINRIFDPFYRIEAGRTKDGLGLGLSVVKGITDALKGEITVESKKGLGTTISIILPLGKCIRD